MLKLSLLLAGCSALCVSAASAATQELHAVLSAASEVPPTTSSGTGSMNAKLDTDTQELTYTLTFTGLPSDMTAAHIHGPADSSKSAGVVVPLSKGGNSPVQGSVKLTKEQMGQLLAGLDYVNIHTKNDPSGAIRGQLTQ